MSELDHKEGWIPKNCCFWTVVLEKTLESPLDCKEIKPVKPKGNQSWICIGRTDAEAEALILWPPDAKNWLIGKTLMLERIEGRRRRGQQDEMVGWHHWLNGRVWASSGSWWWTEKPGMLQSMESQRAGHDLATELTDWTVAHQAPLPMKFSRQEYWSGLPFPPPADLPDLEIELASLASFALAGRFFTTEPLGKPNTKVTWIQKSLLLT